MHTASRPAERVVGAAPGQGVLAAATQGGAVLLFDLPSGAPRAPLLGHAGPVRVVAIAADAPLLATLGDDRALRLWGLAPPSCA